MLDVRFYEYLHFKGKGRIQQRWNWCSHPPPSPLPLVTNWLIIETVILDLLQIRSPSAVSPSVYTF